MLEFLGYILARVIAGVVTALTDINLLSPAIASNGAGEPEHYAGGNGFVPQEFSAEHEIEREEVPY